MSVLEHPWVQVAMRIIYYAGLFSLLIPIWAGYKERHSLQKPHRIMWWCCIMWAVSTLLAESLRLTGHHNEIVWDVATVLEVLFIGWAFYLVIHSFKVQIFLRWAGGVFLAVAFLDTTCLSDSYHSNTYTIALGSVLVILLMLLYFEQTLQELRVISLERDPMFLIGVGVVTYYAATTVIFLMEQTRHMQFVQYRLMMMVNSVACVAFHLIVARAFRMAAQQQLSEPIAPYVPKPTITLRS